MMPFLRNCWYIAAWEQEVSEQPVGRTILNEPVALFRSGEDEYSAIAGVCSHRFAPLGLGKVVEGRIECPYHGLQFDAVGKCVFNPQGNGATPAALNLKSYPLLRRHGALWIWMGDPERADPDLLPDFEYIDDQAGRKIIRGYIYSKANYELLTDNIMDLGHTDFVHAKTLGSPTFATSRAQITVNQVGTAVQCNRWMPDDAQAPMLHWLYELDGKVDTWGDVTWNAPSLMTLHFGMTKANEPRAAGRDIPSAHLMTPETDNSTHYFWTNTRDFKIDDEQLSQQIYDGFMAAFVQEDMMLIDAQQRAIAGADLMSLRPAMLATDAGPMLARRTLAKMIAQEQTEEAVLA